MATELPTNSDLAWDLDDFTQAQRAMDFVLQFETTLCVYSPSVEQRQSNQLICLKYSLYTNKMTVDKKVNGHLERGSPPRSIG